MRRDWVWTGWVLASVLCTFPGCDGATGEDGIEAPDNVTDSGEGDSEDVQGEEEGSAEFEVIVLESERDSAVLPAHLVFAQLKGGGLGDQVHVEGILRESGNFVDVDGLDGDTYPFRVRLLDADGNLLWKTSIREPIQVREFLGNAGLEEYGIDPLQALPAVGEFVFKAPAMQGAHRLVFERMELDGVPTSLGEFAYGEIPDIGASQYAGATVTKIVGNAPPEEALDIAIVGDGYTEAELAVFKTHAGKISSAFTKESPYADFFPRLNFYRIDIPSAESGASYDCSDDEEIEGCVDDLRDTAFGSIFPLRIGVLLDVEVSDRAIFQLKQWELYKAAALTPFDTIVILVNTKKYGAFGIYNASLSAYLDNLGKVTVHEMGHSFALLGDEYIVEGDICQGYELTPDYPNITPLPEPPESVKWSDWLTEGAPLPTPTDGNWTSAVGLFQGAGGGCLDYYRPQQNCLMRSSSSSAPLCAVCQEQTILRLYEHFDLLSGEGIRADGNALVPIHHYGADWHADWTVDGEPAGEGAARLEMNLPAGVDAAEFQVKLTVEDTTANVRTGRERLKESATARVKVLRK